MVFATTFFLKCDNVIVSETALQREERKMTAVLQEKTLGFTQSAAVFSLAFYCLIIFVEPVPWLVVIFKK